MSSVVTLGSARMSSINLTVLDLRAARTSQIGLSCFLHVGDFQKYNRVHQARGSNLERRSPRVSHDR